MQFLKKIWEKFNGGKADQERLGSIASIDSPKAESSIIYKRFRILVNRFKLMNPFISHEQVRGNIDFLNSEIQVKKNQNKVDNSIKIVPPENTPHNKDAESRQRSNSYEIRS